MVGKLRCSAQLFWLGLCNSRNKNQRSIFRLLSESTLQIQGSEHRFCVELPHGCPQFVTLWIDSAFKPLLGFLGTQAASYLFAATGRAALPRCDRSFTVRTLRAVAHCMFMTARLVHWLATLGSELLKLLLLHWTFSQELEAVPQPRSCSFMFHGYFHMAQAPAMTSWTSQREEELPRHDSFMSRPESAHAHHHKS